MSPLISTKTHMLQEAKFFFLICSCRHLLQILYLRSTYYYYYLMQFIFSYSSCLLHHLIVACDVVLLLQNYGRTSDDNIFVCFTIVGGGPRAYQPNGYANSIRTRKHEQRHFSREKQKTREVWLIPYHFSAGLCFVLWFAINLLLSARSALSYAGLDYFLWR